MKVLATRANGFVYIGPFIIILTLVYCVAHFNAEYIAGDGVSFLFTLLDRSFLVSLFICVVSMVVWGERIITPRVIIEYDDKGFYIYKYKNSDPIILRYEEMYGAFAKEDLSEVHYRRNAWTPRRRISNPTWGLIKTGNLRLETPTDFITLRGVKNVNDVRHEMTKLVREHKRKQNEFLDYNIELAKAKKEAEEQEKHNINT